jgi:DNA repair protein RadC
MLSEGKQNRPIKSWSRPSRDDQPRSKLLENGPSILSNSELLAIIIGSGTRNGSAVEVAKKIMTSVQNNLWELGRLSVNGFQHFNGIGQAKALTICAAIELGRRRHAMEQVPLRHVSQSEDAFNLIFPVLSEKQHEEFWVLLLNRSNRLLAKKMISRGGVSGTVVDAKLIFKQAIEFLASSVILAHNHPSGHLKPSTQDIQLTRKLIKAGALLDIQVLDHLIVGRGEYLSLADEGLMG